MILSTLFAVSTCIQELAPYNHRYIFSDPGQDKNAVEVVAVSLDPEKPKTGDEFKYNVTLNISILQIRCMSLDKFL